MTRESRHFRFQGDRSLKFRSTTPTPNQSGGPEEGKKTWETPLDAGSQDRDGSSQYQKSGGHTVTGASQRPLRTEIREEGPTEMNHRSPDIRALFDHPNGLSPGFCQCYSCEVSGLTSDDTPRIVKGGTRPTNYAVSLLKDVTRTFITTFDMLIPGRAERWNLSTGLDPNTTSPLPNVFESRKTRGLCLKELGATASFLIHLPAFATASASQQDFGKTPFTNPKSQSRGREVPSVPVCPTILRLGLRYET